MRPGAALDRFRAACDRSGPAGCSLLNLNAEAEARYELLVANPFPADLAPPGYRLQQIAPVLDRRGRATHTIDVTFAGPDDENSLHYYVHAMDRDEVFRYWREASVGWAAAGGTTPDFLPVEDLGSHSYCEADRVPGSRQFLVRCVAAFDGLAVIAESLNDDPEGAELAHAAALLRAGSEHWETIAD